MIHNVFAHGGPIIMASRISQALVHASVARQGTVVDLMKNMRNQRLWDDLLNRSRACLTM